EVINLDQNYPNPFNPTTTIKYSVPVSSGFVSLKVFDVLGKEITTLVNEVQQPGNYEVAFIAENLASGVYYYTLKANGNIITKKMILLK
ncbi:MAG: T9SS type A sorting domain-containing protein, partial [Ignavibacteriae bacterium]|nr:T9SS type A sorting domain-containing protein [Ignavibacteriota bacterium]